MTHYSSTPAIEELAKLDQWVNWRFERNEAGKPTKIPTIPGTGTNASHSDPATWGTHEQALAWDASKIGFVFAPNDPYCGVDLDDCLDAGTGKLTEEAAEIVRLLDSYTEISPSGTGIKVFSRGILPAAIKHPDGVKIEAYDRSRFFTVTRQHLAGTPTGIGHRQGELDLLVERFGSVPRRKGRGKASLTEITDALDRSEVGYRLVQESYGTIVRLDTCLTSDAHDDGAYFTVFPNGTAQYGCHHNSCQDKRWAQAAPRIGLNPEECDPLPSSDEANAERLIALHGRDWRHCAETKTDLLWDGTRWGKDRTGHILQLAKDVGRAYLDDAKRDGLTDKQRDAVVKRGATALEHPRLVRMVALARVDPRIAVLPEQLDADPWLLNCPNGTVELRWTGKLRPHRREDLITRLTRAEYDPGATLAAWDRALLAATEGYDVAAGERGSTPEEAALGAEKRAFLQRLAGISATGDASEEYAPFLHGPPRSGKGTILSPILEALGDYAKTTDFDTFLKRAQPGGIRTDLVRLDKARMVASVEVEDGRQLATALFKRLTGGDTQTARGLYTSEIVLRPTQTYWLVANQSPRIDSGEAAVWRRILRVPFEHEVPVEKIDPKVKQHLMDMDRAGPAILAWIVAGCLAWQEEGLRIPAFVREATEALRREMDTFSDFVDAEGEIAPGATVGTGTLKDRYLDWHRRMRQSGQPMGLKEFKEKLRDRGITEGQVFVKGKRVRVYHGIRLQDQPGPGETSEGGNKPPEYPEGGAFSKDGWPGPGEEVSDGA